MNILKCTKLLLNIPKFINGERARKVWSKNINEEGHLTVEEFSNISGVKFVKMASIQLDNSLNRQTTIKFTPFDEYKDPWDSDKFESVYLFTRNSLIMKIGGSRSSMKGRSGSYLCGHHVPERKKSGKMSVTNAYLYHTIENDLIENVDSSWEIYIYNIEPEIVTRNFMGEELKIKAQLFHGYEAKTIRKYKEHTGKNPQLSLNSDPDYQKSINKMKVHELITECEEQGLEPYTNIEIRSGQKKVQLKSKSKEDLTKMLLSKDNL